MLELKLAELIIGMGFPQGICISGEKDKLI
jgi:hypothetical protein